MAEILELPQLPQDDRVAEMDVEAGRVDAELDPERLAGRDAALQLLAQFVFGGDLVDAAADEGELFVRPVASKRSSLR